MNSITIDPIFDSLALVSALALLGLGLILTIRPSGTDVSVRRRRWLIGLRLAAFILLVLSLLRPAWVRTDSRPATATLAVLIDHSRSMTLPDGEGESRWETARQLIRRLAPRLNDFDADLDIQYYAFGDQAERVPVEDLDKLLQSPPDRDATDMATALRAAMTGTSGRPLAGVVLIGDGTSTDAASNPAIAARTLASLEVPLWTVPIGPARGDSQLRDVAIEQLPEAFQVFSKNLFRVTASVRTRGLSGRDVPVRVLLIDSDGRETELATRNIAPSAADDTALLDVELVAPEPGSYRLEVVAPPQPGETMVDNNRQIAFLDVREGGGRILFIEGAPRVEQLFIRRAIDESPDLEMDEFWVDGQSRSRWPVDLGDATAPGRYDVYVIGDVDAAALGEENLRAIAERVSEGSGLLMIGGLHNFDAGGYADSPLADPLPIRMDPSKRVPVDVEPPESTMLGGPVPVQMTRPHPITQLSSGRGDSARESARLWNSLKPLLGATRFMPPKVGPSIEVLLESPDRDPLLVVGQFGSGRTAAFAGDSTWQWWRQGHSDLHRRFWRQLMLWLLARDAPEMDSAWITMSTRRFDRADGATFLAGVQTLGGQLRTFDLSATILDSAGNQIPVATTAEGTGGDGGGDDPLISGKIPDLPAGLYTLRVENRGGDGTIEPAEMLFQVLDVDAELSRPIADVSRLEQLAELTSEAGGRSFRADQSDDLLTRIADLRQRAVLPIVEKFRFGDGPISGWFAMLGFISLLSTEWFLRKRWGLV